MPETLTQYIARMKAEKQAADFLAGKLRATPPAFRSGVSKGLQLAFPGATRAVCRDCGKAEDEEGACACCGECGKPACVCEMPEVRTCRVIGEY